MTNSLTVRSYQNLAIMIEGFGTADGNYRYCLNDPPSFDSDNLYQVCLDSWPDEIGTEVDFRTGKVSQTSMNFRLRRTDRTLADFARAKQPVPLGNGEFVSATSTTIETDITDGSLENTVVYWEREAILFGNHGGAGEYSGCQRGILQTTPITHAQGEKSNRVIFAEMPINSIKGRKVTLIRVSTFATSYDDEEVLFVGVLDQKKSNGIGFELVCRDGLSLLTDFKLMEKPATFTGSRFSNTKPDAGYGDGELSEDTLSMIVVDQKSGYIANVKYNYTGDPPYRLYKLRMNSFQPVLNFPLAEASENNVYNEVLTTHISQPSNSATPDTFTLPLSQEPAILILQLLTSTANDGQPGGNGEYDTGINNISTSIPIDLIDVEGILAWGRRQGIYKVDNLFLGLNKEKESVFDIIEKILQPFGSVLLLGKQSKLTIASLADAKPFGTDNNINEEDILSIGNYQDYQIEDTLDRVVVKYGLVPGVGESQDDTIDALKGRYLPPGARSQIEIDATAYSSRYVSRGVATNLLFRYRFPPPIVILETNPYLNIYPGDVCTVSHSQLLGNKSIGWENETCLVIGRKEVYDNNDYGQGEHYLELTLAWVGAIYDNNFNSFIAPSARVSSYNAGTRVITINENRYVNDTNEYFEKDSEAFYVLDKIQICDQYGTVQESVATISVVGTNQLTLLLTPSYTPIAGDIVRMASYDQAQTIQKERWCFIADANDQVDGSVNNSYNYVIG